MPKNAKEVPECTATKRRKKKNKEKQRRRCVPHLLVCLFNDRSEHTGPSAEPDAPASFRNEESVAFLSQV